jgi:hypothetical protein
MACEVDACYTHSDNIAQAHSGIDLDQLAQRMGNTKILSIDTTVDSNSTSSISIRQGGRIVPQSDLIELKTCAEHKLGRFDWADAYPQLFLSQTPHHLIAAHVEGTFRSMKRGHLDSDDMRRREASAQPKLKKLRALLQSIQELLVSRGTDAKLSLVCHGEMLELFDRTSPSLVVPADVLKRFL